MDRVASVRYRDCSGGYTCPNTECLFFKQFKYSNRTNFTMNGTCEYCSASGNHQSCSAQKYIAFSNDKEAYVYVYHCGNRTCTAKYIHKRSFDIVKDVLSKDCNITPPQIQSMNILADLRSRKNWNKVEKNAHNVANVKAFSNENVKQKKALQPSGVGFGAIKELKTYTDLQDPYLIHVINENEQYVFKTSSTQMMIACSMDTDGDPYMHEEYCHYDGDGNHKIVKAFVTLTPSVYHSRDNELQA